jgi:hypothetical protein
VDVAIMMQLSDPQADTTISSRASSPESCGLCLKDFKGQFSASATQAAENLGIGITEFKQMCRQLGM